MIVKGFIGHHLGVAVNTLQKDFVATMKENGLPLNPAQFTILARLCQADGLTQQDIAVYAVRDRASVTRTLDKLERLNFIERRQSDTDRRANRIHVTHDGRHCFETALPIVRKLNKKAIEGLSQQELDDSIRVMARIIANAGGYAPWDEV